MDKGGGTRAGEKGLVAKSPQYTDAGHFTISGGLYIHIAVAHIHRIGFGYAELRKGFEHSIGGGFLSDALALADGYRDVRTEKMLAQLLSGGIKLIAHNSNVLSTANQFFKHLHHTGIRLRVVESVLQVMRTKSGVGFAKLRMSGSVGNSPLHQFFHSVSHKEPHLFKGSLGHPRRAQGIVAAGSQVGQRIEKRSV